MPSYAGLCSMTGPVPAHPDWAPHIAAFLAAYRLRGLSEQSADLRRNHLCRVSREIGKSPFEVTLDDLITYLGSRKWKNETARAFRSSLRVFYAWAVKTGRTVNDPAAELPSIKPSGPNPKPVPEDVFAALLTGTDVDEDVRWMIRLAGEVGMRRAEVARVHRDHIVKDADGWLIKILGKGNKPRTIPISERLARELLAFVDTTPGGYAFPSRAGGAAADYGDTHMSPHWVGTLVSDALPEGYTMHKLRHRAATQAHRRSGGDLLLTSKLLGHSSVATTQIYVAPDVSRLRAVVEEIGS